MNTQTFIAQPPQPAAPPTIPPVLYEWGLPGMLLVIGFRSFTSLIDKHFSRLETSIDRQTQAVTKQTEAIGNLTTEIKTLVTTTSAVAAQSEETADEVADLKATLTANPTNGRQP